MHIYEEYWPCNIFNEMVLAAERVETCRDTASEKYTGGYMNSLRSSIEIIPGFSRSQPAGAITEASKVDFNLRWLDPREGPGLRDDPRFGERR